MRPKHITMSKKNHRVINKTKKISYQITKDLKLDGRNFIDTETICSTFIHINDILNHVSMFILDNQNDSDNISNDFQSSNFARTIRFTYEIKYDIGIKIRKQKTINKCSSLFFIEYDYKNAVYVFPFSKNMTIKIKTVSETNTKIISMMSGKTGKHLKYENEKFSTYDKKMMGYKKEKFFEIVTRMLKIIHDAEIHIKYYDDFLKNDIQMNKEKILSQIKENKKIIYL
jgi:hypothetical protein